MENEEVALAISEYLHSLDVCQPLAYYMARGLSIELARVAVAAQHSVEPTVYHSGNRPAEDNQSESESPE